MSTGDHLVQPTNPRRQGPPMTGPDGTTGPPGARVTPPAPGAPQTAGPRRDPVWEAVARRVLDVVVSVLVLVLPLPFWIAVALWLRHDSPGPALLRQ